MGRTADVLTAQSRLSHFFTGASLAWSIGVQHWRTLVFALAAIAATATSARAQTQGTLSLGWEVGPMLPIDSSAGGSSEFGLVWRLGRYETGWGWHWGLNWYETHIRRDIGGVNVELGNLHVRPITAGYGYTFVSGRTTVIADVLGGFAFTSMSMSEPAQNLYQRLGAPGARLDTGLAWVLRPEAMLWYDINKNFGLVVNVGYMLARPTMTIRSAAKSDAVGVNADMLGIQVGLAYSIF